MMKILPDAYGATMPFNSLARKASAQFAAILNGIRERAIDAERPPGGPCFPTAER